ncbi:MAG: adenylate/guanylate cyclase domain-containing protein, partial [Bdellovibrionota bacterium]
IDSGKAIVGNIGSTHRMNYTIVGDTVNLASRLEGLNKAYGTRICISQATRSQLNSTFAVRELDLVKIRGMNMVIHVYELMGYNGQNPDLEALVPRYEEALSLFRARKFGEAEKLFDQCRIQGVLDSPSHTLIRRCQIYKNNPPDPSWDGVWVPVNQ